MRSKKKIDSLNKSKTLFGLPLAYFSPLSLIIQPIITPIDAVRHTKALKRSGQQQIAASVATMDKNTSGKHFIYKLKLLAKVL